MSAAAGLGAVGRPLPTHDAPYHGQNVTLEGMKFGWDRAELAWLVFWTAITDQYRFGLERRWGLSFHRFSE